MTGSNLNIVIINVKIDNVDIIGLTIAINFLHLRI